MRDKGFSFLLIRADEFNCIYKNVIIWVAQSGFVVEENEPRNKLYLHFK